MTIPQDARPPRRGPRFVAAAGAAAALAVLLALIGALTGPPSLFGDTPFYYTQGRFLAERLGYSARPLTQIERDDALSVLPGSRGAATGALDVAGARPPLYGLFLFLTERLGGLRLTAALQAALTALAVSLFLNGVARRPVQATLAATPLLVLGSSAPFFAAFMMPDVFAGTGVLMIARIATTPARLTGGGVAAAALLAAGVACHPSHLLTAILVVPVGIGLALASGERWGEALRRLGLAALAVGAGFALDHGARALYQAGTLQHQAAPPFLMARILEDGPGRDYLASHCPGGAAPRLCGADPRGLRDAETFLWAAPADGGVYMASSLAARRALKEAEPAFVLAAATAEPVKTAASALRNLLLQVSLFSTIEPLKNPAAFLRFPIWRGASIWRVYPNRVRCEQDAGACAPRISPLLVNIIDATVLVASIFALACVGALGGLRRRLLGARPAQTSQRAVLACVVAGAGVLANDAVCAVISGPFPRYEARLIWIVPLLAVVIFDYLAAPRATIN